MATHSSVLAWRIPGTGEPGGLPSMGSHRVGHYSSDLAAAAAAAMYMLGFLVVLVVKNPSANAGDIRDAGSIPGLGKSPGEGHGNPLQYSCQENPWTEEPGVLQFMGVTQSCTRLKQLSPDADNRSWSDPWPPYRW